MYLVVLRMTSKNNEKWKRIDPSQLIHNKIVPMGWTICNCGAVIETRKSKNPKVGIPSDWKAKAGRTCLCGYDILHYANDSTKYLHCRSCKKYYLRGGTYPLSGKPSDL